MRYPITNFLEGHGQWWYVNSVKDSVYVPPLLNTKLHCNGVSLLTCVLRHHPGVAYPQRLQSTFFDNNRALRTGVKKKLCTLFSEPVGCMFFEKVNVSGDPMYSGIYRKAVRRKIGDSPQEKWKEQNGTVSVLVDPPDVSHVQCEYPQSCLFSLQHVSAAYPGHHQVEVTRSYNENTLC
jgi:hypothetical protein